MKILIIFFIFVLLVIIISVTLLKGFDRIAGRGPYQIKKGINKSKLIKDDNDRYPCPSCAELIKKKAKICRFCGKKL